MAESSKESEPASDPTIQSSDLQPGPYLSKAFRLHRTLPPPSQILNEYSEQNTTLALAQLAVLESNYAIIENQRQHIACQEAQKMSQHRLTLAEYELDDYITKTKHQRAAMLKIPASSKPADAAVNEGGLWTPAYSKDPSGVISRQSRKGEDLSNESSVRDTPQVHDDENSKATSVAQNLSWPSMQPEEDTKHSQKALISSTAGAIGSAVFHYQYDKNGALVRHYDWEAIHKLFPDHVISPGAEGLILIAPLSQKPGVNRGRIDLRAYKSVPDQDPLTRKPSVSDPMPCQSGQMLTDLNPIMEEFDPTLQDAGHTPKPLGRTGGPIIIDGGAGDVDESTPKVKLPPASQEPIRQPSERQDSYFGSIFAPADVVIGNPLVLPQDQTPDRDTPLKGDLGLTDSPDNERNKAILCELNKKLSHVALTEAAGNMKSSSSSSPYGDPSKPSHGPVDSPLRNVDEPLRNVDGSPCEVPEPEPPLRLKKSTNFGSAFGKGEEVDYGKGFPKQRP